MDPDDVPRLREPDEFPEDNQDDYDDHLSYMNYGSKFTINNAQTLTQGVHRDRFYWPSTKSSQRSGDRDQSANYPVERNSS